MEKVEQPVIINLPNVDDVDYDEQEDAIYLEVKTTREQFFSYTDFTEHLINHNLANSLEIGLYVAVKLGEKLILTYRLNKLVEV